MKYLKASFLSQIARVYTLVLSVIILLWISYISFLCFSLPSHEIDLISIPTSRVNRSINCDNSY